MINLGHYQTLVSTTPGKKSYENNKFKISGTRLGEEFELFDGPYSITDIQN